ncbi:MAG TPA: hypothetical protein VFS18_03280, partial [Actinomycetota bacterium]|nr:hypothetical protein [Actinomycetota bacterium]
APVRPHRVGFGRPEPPETHVSDPGGGSGWVTLTRASNDIEAHLITGRLLEAGVGSSTVKDRTSPGAWLYVGSNPSDPVTILVRRLQLQEARLVLLELAYHGPDAVPAPTEVPRWRATVVWWAAAIGLGLLFTGLGLVQAANDIAECARSGACAERTGSAP